DRDLLRRPRRRLLPGRRERYGGVLADLRNTADEEAALVFDGDRSSHELRHLCYGSGRRRDSYERNRNGELHGDDLIGERIRAAERIRGRPSCAARGAGPARPAHRCGCGLVERVVSSVSRETGACRALIYRGTMESSELGRTTSMEWSA